MMRSCWRSAGIVGRTDDGRRGLPAAAGGIRAKERRSYLTRIESTVLPGKQRAFEAFLDGLYAISARAPGFRVAGAAGSIAHPSRHIGIALWDDAASAAALHRGDAYQNYLAANPPSALVTPVRAPEGYDVVARVQDRPTNEAGVLALFDVSVDRAQIAAFEAEIQQRLELRTRVGHGLVSNTLCRSLSEPGQYFLFFVHTDDAALQATADALEVRAAREARPVGSLGDRLVAQDRGGVVKIAVPALVA